MALEYAENSVQLLANLIALLLCLFQYISNKKKGWIYATVVFLCSLMSSYYWTAYLVIMGDSPNISNAFSYFGWNVAFAALLVLVLHMKNGEERRYFHPLMLLPIPLNIWQLTLYLPYGGVANSVYQVAVMTAVAVFCLQSICWYFKRRNDGAQRPYVAAAALLYAFCEFGMWTSTCFDDPVASLYYPFSFLYSVSFILLPGALILTYRAQKKTEEDGTRAKYQTILKAVYFAVVLVCCVGGIALGVWMRDVMAEGMELGAGADVYNIIPVVLFIISLFLAAFAVAIIFVVNFSQKVAENNELRELRKIADHSNAAKSEFLANMSHEIRTPINAVLGMNKMILRESTRARETAPETPEDARAVFGDICNYAGNIDRAGNNLLSIINDILDFSKIEAGKLDIVETDYKLSSLLNDVSNMIAFRAREKELDFRVDVDSGLPDGLHGDEVRVRQIMTNILSNAVKYTNEGGVVLTVRRGDETPPEQGGTLRLVIAVQDTGIGIRQEDIDKLFRKFERVDLRKNSTVEGTGLGLAITGSLLEMMDGTIGVESVYGEGSTFTVTLPQTIVSTEPVGDFQEKFRKSMEETRGYRESFRAPEAHILIVDDTRMNLTVAVHLLRATEIKIDTASGGADAIALCRETRYDLILMDQRMPEMDGTEAMRRIRAQSGGANRETPFICLTADAVSGARERYLAEGFTDYLTKPIDDRALERMLIQHLPADKVLRTQQDAAEGPCPAPEYADLQAAGIDPASGLRYCGGKEDMYRAALLEYARGMDEKLQALQSAYETRNWKDYAVYAHAVKSTSKMIGAGGLSAAAAALEAAADKEDGVRIGAEHAALLERCAYTAEAIRRLTGSAAPPDADAPDEVLEFLPE